VPHLRVRAMAWRSKKQDLADQPDKIKDAALRLLSRRDFAAEELRRRLLERGGGHDKIEEVIDYLCQCGFINETALVENWLRYRLEINPRGRAYVKQELLNRGVNEQIVQESIERLYNDEQEEIIIVRLANKEIVHNNVDFDDKEMEKYCAKLMRRWSNQGFCQNNIINGIKLLRTNFLDKDKNLY